MVGIKTLFEKWAIKNSDVKTITKVVVGSQLHGLADEKSDFDYRGIFMHSLKDLISPFKKLKNSVWIEGDEDNTSYELSNFCKYAAQGNPTILEVLWSNQIIEDSPIAKELRKNRHKFLDSKRIYEAHKGYSHNQYKKMDLVNPNERTPKYCVAYMRSLIQGADLLRFGEFNPQVVRHKQFMLDIKNDFKGTNIGKIMEVCNILLEDIDVAYEKNKEKYKADVEWIEKFLVKTYK